MKKLLVLILTTLTLNASSVISGAGASFPAHIYMSWTKSYEKATGNKINYQSIGSGGGIKQIKMGTIDFGGSDEPLTPQELSKYNLLQFPTLSGAIVIVYHLDGIKDGQLKLSNEVISDIFLGNITKWNDAKILKDNPTLNLPATNIELIHRSDGSGTTYNFTLYLSEISKIWKDKIGYGKAISWPIGTGAKGNEGVSALVKQTKNSIGYVELSYKEQMNLNAAQIQDVQKEWVSANKESISNASKNAKWDKKADFSTSLLNQKGKNTYPLVSATFILLPKNGKNAIESIKFFDYAFKNGDKEALKMGFIPLPEKTKELIREYWKENKLY
ncbi:phosphate ABC transporter substrate-binding protein PstS [Helicobacter cappadocius]|uniref:Phosphate-binding protein n=1 Tax=Helicobacter cappadocius TaxID=3063998 RepID=A0AA90PU12_9HELI|nr:MULTISPECIES: phosphate ABC transporter substrate-binding protein PstS [unclassified Helicobacter]MDO7253606.1 phosphate ABC transporter substrate-binding protein PstS [Helicobacter sp. faydin-H75]MDP2539534.1 phosphate ABC transporter substrate-binding protein PstS [Helicobacter sp. faydin-H76]